MKAIQQMKTGLRPEPIAALRFAAGRVARPGAARVPCGWGMLAVFCSAMIAGAAFGAGQPEVPAACLGRIDQMPRAPTPYVLRDWERVTQDYLDFAFDFDRQGKHLPLMRWQDARRRMIWMPAYVGNADGPEAINYLAAVVSGSLVGVDMRTYRGHDWVAMGTNFFNPADGICLDWADRNSGSSLWYDVLPNVLFFQVGGLYPGDRLLEKRMLAIAERWYEACVALGGGSQPSAVPNFDHTGFDLRRMKPYDNGKRIEPEGAAGIAWLEYVAWCKFGDPRFLAAAEWCLRALERRPLEQSPLYEVLLPYAVITAARLNAEQARNYDVGRLINWCFEPGPAPQARPYWGVILGNWSGKDVGGLVGSSTDGGGYAFAMNTFQYAGTLAPLCRYDARYAHALGKWLLNLANAARLFYPNAHDAHHQSSFAWASQHDPKSVIAYEGLRKFKRGSQAARADYRTVAGKTTQGNYASTHYYREEPREEQVLEETRAGADVHLDHTWEFNLPAAPERYLVVAAERTSDGSSRNAFRFSYASDPDGPFREAFHFTNSFQAEAVELPAALGGKLYVRVQSTDRSPGRLTPDRLKVDAMAIAYRSETGPFAQGDLVVSFVDLVKNCTVPLVLYRPEAAATDLGLYGSSHVGMLGGLVKPTNVEKLLQWDLRKTDFFGAPAGPTFLYYNPADHAQTIEVAVGSEARDVYDTVSKAFLARNVRGKARIAMPPDSARVLVLTPAGGKLLRAGQHTLVDGVVVDYGGAPAKN